MSALWKLGTINVFASDEDISREVKRAEILILDSTESIWHFFGAGSEKRNLKGKVMGEADRLAIIALAIGDTAFTLATPWGNASSMKINGSPKFSAVQYGGATIDGVNYVANTDPIYELDCELIST